MSTFSIENAKSGRSACKNCKEKIGKGELRIGKSIEVKDGVTPESFVEDLLEDQTDDQILSKDAGRQQIIDAMWQQRNKKTPTKKKKTSDESSLYGRLSNIRKERENDENDDGKRKKQKLSKDEEEQFEIMMSIETTQAKSPTLNELKDVCKWNRQHVSGTKATLMARIIDGQMYGRLGRCPLCTQGRLQLKDDNATEVICKGYFDEEKSYRVDCGNVMSVKEAPRLHPWFATQPSEEEKSEMVAADELAKTGVDPSANKQALEVYLKAASDKLEWEDVSSAPDMKQAAKELVAVLLSVDGPMRLDLPTDKAAAVKKVGPIVAANRSAKVPDLLETIASELGFSEQKAQAEERKSKAMKTACKHEGNMNLLMAMSELKDLYFKEGNKNAGSTYAKISKVISEFEFEVTADNAKGLGKGKTKVAGIGKSSADKMYEFVTTGTMAKLEEKRAENAS